MDNNKIETEGKSPEELEKIEQQILAESQKRGKEDAAKAKEAELAGLGTNTTGDAVAPPTQPTAGLVVRVNGIDLTLSPIQPEDYPLVYPLLAAQAPTAGNGAVLAQLIDRIIQRTDLSDQEIGVLSNDPILTYACVSVAIEGYILDLRQRI